MITENAAILAGFLGGLLCLTALGQDLPRGMGLNDDEEKRIEKALASIAELVKPDKPDWAKVFAELGPARKDAEHLVGLARSEQKLRVPDEVKVPANPPVVLLGDAKADEVRALWLEQLRMNVKAAAGMLAGDKDTLNEWVGSPDSSKPQNRAQPVADALREAERCARLLAAEPIPVAVKPAEILFSDDFAKGAENWLCFGQCVTANEKDAFRMKDEKPAHPDAMMWTKKEFDGDLLVEFTFIPHSEGARPGALFSICGRPRPGKQLDACVGDSMNTYNFGIDAYHFSMHRGNTGLGNVRRVGPGLKMLASGKDPCPEVGKEYKVAIGKVDAAIFLFVDGKLVHNYLDAGTYGAVLTAGRIGIRHWGGMDGSYKNFRVSRLVKVADKPAALIEPKGKTLFEEKFENLDNWRKEGAGTMALDKDEKTTLRLECVGSGQGKTGAQAFCLTDFPDGVALEYDIKVLTKNGLVITFVAMRGIDGGDMFDPKMPKREGVFGDYVRNPKLRSYHVSVSRYDDNGEHTGVSNWRRNPGLNLMKEGKDLCKEIGRWYHVRIVKDGGHCQLGVDGVLAHEFTDPGELKTPMPDSGKIGFRAIGADVRALIKNVKVTALK